MVGPGLTIIAIVELDAAQGGFEIVQAKTFVPNANPVIVEFGCNELVITPEPETNDQAPVPTVAALAASVALGTLKHNVWLGPALATVGKLFTVIVTFELEAVHGLFEMVQAKTLLPNPNPVIGVVGDIEFEITPLPKIKDQVPTPTVAVFANIVVVGLEIHKV